MEKLKNILINNWQLLIVIVLSGFIIWPLFLPGYFSHHDDLQVMRIFEMRSCLEDFQIPCRWVPDMGYGNGFPLFNYYGVLPFYIGAVFSFVLGFIVSAKILFFIPLFFAGITMYFLGKELFLKNGGLVAAVLYEFAPYRAVDSYVRGAVNESFGLFLIPLVFYTSLKLIKQNSLKNFLFFAVSLGLFLTSHNIMTLLFGPFILIWIIYLLVLEKFKNLKSLVLSFLLGVGLASFFILPAFLEKNLVQTNTLTEGGLDFRGHFATLTQLFLSRFWGYGASVFGPDDTISFQIGLPHWPLAFLAICSSLFLILRKKFKYLGLSIFFFVSFLISVFMTHNKSTPIWDSIQIIQFTQFPWRFLGLSIFFASLLGGLFIALIPKKISLYAAILILLLTLFLNASYFKPEYFYTYMTDQQKLTGELWKIQQQAGILDYLPITAQEPKGPRPFLPEVISGYANVSNFVDKSNHWSFYAEVTQSANLEVPVFDFPNWLTFVNGKQTPHSHNNRLGRIRLDLPPGNYQIQGVLYNTSIRNIANIITLISFIILIYLIYVAKFKKQK